MNGRAPAWTPWIPPGPVLSPERSAPRHSSSAGAQGAPARPVRRHSRNHSRPVQLRPASAGIQLMMEQSGLYGIITNWRQALPIGTPFLCQLSLSGNGDRVRRCMDEYGSTFLGASRVGDRRIGRESHHGVLRYGAGRLRVHLCVRHVYILIVRIFSDCPSLGTGENMHFISI